MSSVFDLRLYLLSEQRRWHGIPGVFVEDGDALYIPLDVALQHADALLDEQLDWVRRRLHGSPPPALALWSDLIVTIGGEVWNDWFAEELWRTLVWLRATAETLETDAPARAWAWSRSRMTVHARHDHIVIEDDAAGFAHFPRRHLPRQQFLQKLSREGRDLFALFDLWCATLRTRDQRAPEIGAALAELRTLRRDHARALARIENVINARA